MPPRQAVEPQHDKLVTLAHEVEAGSPLLAVLDVAGAADLLGEQLLATGRGTAHMIGIAREAGVEVVEVGLAERGR